MQGDVGSAQCSTESCVESCIPLLTVLTFDNIRYNQSLDDDLFTIRQLERE